MKAESTSISDPLDLPAIEIAGTSVQFILDAAPRMPENIAREAAIRLGGWLLDIRPHLAQHTVKDASGTEITLQFANHAATANVFRHSGASALVARYIVRRAGIIGGPGDGAGGGWRRRPSARDHALCVHSRAAVHR